MSEEKILIDVQLENEDLAGKIADITKEISLNKDEIKELSKNYEDNQGEIEKLTEANKQLLREKNQIVKAQVQEANSLNALRAKLALLTTERNKTNTATAEGRKRFEELQKEILITSSRVKKFEQDGGDFRRNVGNYTNSLKEAAAGTKVFSQGVGIMNNALKANPVLLIVAALFKLFDAVSQMQGAVDAFNRVIAPFNAMFQRLIGLFQDLSSGIADKLTKAFNDPKQALQDLGDFIVNNVINRFKAFGVIINAIANRDMKALADGFIQFGSGVENATDKIAAFGKEMSDAAKLGRELVDMQIDLEKAVIDNTLREAELTLEYEKQVTASKDLSKTAAERAEAARQAEELLAQIEQGKLDIQQKQLDIAQKKAKLNDTDRKTQEELSQQQAAMLKTQAESVKKQRELNAAKEAERKENEKIHKEKLKQIEDERKAREDAEMALFKRELKAIQDLEQFRLELEIKRAKTIEERIAKELQLEEFKLKRQLQNESLIDAEREKILFESLVRQNDLREKAKQEQRNIEIKGLQDYMKARQMEVNAQSKQVRDSIMLAQIEADNKRMLQEMVVGNFIAILGSTTKFQKAAAIAQIAFDQGAALAGALRNSQSPTPDNVLTGGLAGLAKFTTLAASIGTSVQRIRQIVNSGQSANFANIARPTVFTGQIGQQQQDQGLNNQFILRSIQSLPRPAVSVTEINRVNQRANVKVLETTL